MVYNTFLKRAFYFLYILRNAISRDKTFSQLGQDLWVAQQVKHYSKLTRRYFFCDVGAGHPTKYSNTFLLEKGGEWDGLLIDVHPERIKQLRAKRKSTVIDCAVSDLPFEKIFLAKDPDFSYSSQINEEDSHRLFEFSGKEIIVEGKRLDMILEENKAPKDFEYLSIDVEGLELKVLQTIDLEVWKPKLITIEHNYRPDREIIYSYLKRFGYKRFIESDTKWDDWYYLA
jgi:FkbM family methyltransferase